MMISYGLIAFIVVGINAVVPNTDFMYMENEIDNSLQDDVNNDNEEMFSDYEGSENAAFKRAVAPSSSIIGACHFDEGYRKCSGFYTSKWLEHNSGSCNDNTYYCNSMRSFGFCNPKRHFYDGMKKHCQRSCGFCKDDCSDAVPECSYLKSRKYCEKDHLFFPSMQLGCKKTCKFCVRRVLYLKTDLSSYIRYTAYTKKLGNVSALKSCQCSSSGICNKIDFCVSFKYALSNVTTDTQTNTLRVHANTYKRYNYTSGGKTTLRGKYGHSIPSSTYIPSGVIGDENKWKKMHAQIKLECGERLTFYIYTGSKQSEMIKFDNVSIEIGKCPSS